MGKTRERNNSKKKKRERERKESRAWFGLEICEKFLLCERTVRRGAARFPPAVQPCFQLLSLTEM